MRLLWGSLVCFLVPAGAAAQSIEPAGEPPAALQAPAAPRALSAVSYVPVTNAERVYWAVNGTIGVRSLTVVGPLSASFQTAVDTPKEWGRSWSGFGKRYLQREIDVAISNSIEAGLGALWGEDPRYVPSGRRGIWPRARYAIKTVVISQRPDGQMAPTWGRYAGNTLNNVIENAWLPPSVTTWEQTALRSASGLLSRLGGNLFEEFWPDVRRRYFTRKH
jgi:hypothetical protein